MQKLSLRLTACAELVRKGSRLADIGCDHGFVPVYLCENGLIKSAVASDINEGPLSSCRFLVKSCGLENKIKCVLSNGLENINEDEIDDILIAGMGGELIADILSACPYIKTKHLVLNPMTHPELARKWLFENGFEIINDVIVNDSGHSYSVFDAEYTGAAKSYSLVDLFLGGIKEYSDKNYFDRLLKYLNNKQKGGEDYSSLISEIEERLKNDNC